MALSTSHLLLAKRAILALAFAVASIAVPCTALAQTEGDTAATPIAPTEAAVAPPTTADGKPTKPIVIRKTNKYQAAKYARNAPAQPNTKKAWDTYKTLEPLTLMSSTGFSGTLVCTVQADQVVAATLLAGNFYLVSVRYKGKDLQGYAPSYIARMLPHKVTFD